MAPDDRQGSPPAGGEPDPPSPGPGDEHGDQDSDEHGDQGGGFARLAGHSALYAVGSISGKVVGLLLVPVLTRALTTVDFGRLDVLSTLATTVTSVAVLGLDVAATRLYAEASEDQRRRLFGSWTSIVVVLGVLIAVVTVVAAPAVSQALFGTADEALAVTFVGAYAIGNLVQVEGLTALRNLRRPVAYAVTSTGAFVVYGVATALLVSARPTLAATLAGMAIGVGVGGISSMLASRRLVIARPDRTATRRLFALGLPLVPALVTLWVGDFVNRAILLGGGGADQVAYLSIAVRIASVGVLVVTGFQLAWPPHAFSLPHTTAARRQLAGESRNIAVAVAVAVALLAVVTPELVLLLAGSAYRPAVTVTGWALALPVAMALYLVATMPSTRTARMGDLGVSATVGALAGIGANVVLAPRFGATGTAAALVVGQATATVVAVVQGRRREAIPVRWAGVLAVSVAGCAVAIASTAPDGGAPLWTRALLVGGFLVVLLVEGALGDLVRFVRGLLGR